MSLMPCFTLPNQAIAEGMIIGRLLAGYGELEVTMCSCLIATEGMFDLPVRTLFDEWNAEKRIKIARKCLTADYTKAGLQVELAEALDDMDWCRKVRNQYAHCQWAWTTQEGLWFVNFEELARQPTPITSLTNNKRFLHVPLLMGQEEYFNYVKECFSHLESVYRAWDQKCAAPRRSIHVLAKPSKILRPPMHN